MKVTTYIDGLEIHNPLNIGELEIQLNFDSGNPDARVTLNEWELGVGATDDKDGAYLCNQHITNGINGTGVGVYEAKALSVIISKNGSNYTAFNGGIDLSTAQIECNRITANSLTKGGVDWLFENADGFNLRDLETGLTNGPGKITANDIILTPYIISSIPNSRDAFITLLSVYVFTRELINNIQALKEHIAGSSNPFQGVDLVKAALRIAHIILTLIGLVKLVNQLFNLLIQPVKYHAGMNVLLQCQRAAQYLGMSFESSILEGTYKDLIIIPEKYEQNINSDKDDVLGFLSPTDKAPHLGSVNMTFGNLLRELISMFNGKIIIDNNVIKLERRDYSTSTALYQLPNIEITPKTYNSEDLKSNYSISFLTDANDNNTIQQYEGVYIGVRTSPKIIGNKDLVLNKGFARRDIAFAMGKIKTELTLPEKIFDTFFESIDFVIAQLVKIVNVAIKILNRIAKTINKIIKSLKTIGIKINIKLVPIKPVTPPVFGNLIDNRLGMLTMETDFVTVPKMLIVKANSSAKNNKPATNNDTILNAEYLWDNYHYINSFDANKYAKNNQYTKLNAENIPFCYSDFQKVEANNKITTQDGKEGLITSLTWNPTTLLANFEYRINEIHSLNFKTTKLIPNGR